MYTITKKACINEVVSGSNAILIAIFTMCLLASLRVWHQSHDVFWAIFMVAFSGISLTVSGFLLRKRVQRITQNSFYLEEDVLIRIEEKHSTLNRMRTLKQGAKYDYDLTFSQSGVHRITLFNKSEPEEFDADYAAVFFSRPGDAFYLAKSTDKNTSIVKCFPAKYYSVSEEDFVRDGDLFRPKNI